MTRLYSLFSRVRGTKGWKRVSLASMTLQAARTFYQNRLIAGAGGMIEYRLRPLDDSKAERSRSYLSAI